MISSPPRTDASSQPLAIEYKAIETLAPYQQNARTHSKRQIRQIADSIRHFEFTNPILIDADQRIIAGHGRVQAAKLLGMLEVPTIQLSGLTESQIRAYMIADNKLAENAGWDSQILAIELQHLIELNTSELDITITGFEIAEIDLILEQSKPKNEPEEEIPLIEPQHRVSQSGDLWKLGKHRLLCGSALSAAAYAELMGSRRANAVISDPPYNVRIDGHATGNGAIRHREFAMASGEMSEAEFVAFLSTALNLFSKHSTEASMHFLFMDWRHLRELSSVGHQVYDSLLNLCVWVKHSGGMGSLYRSQHELIFVFRNGKGSHRNNVQLGRFGRNRTNVWNYPGSNSFSKGEEGDLLTIHPTVKPVALVADAILDCTARGEIVLDSFLGSGTTLMASERVGRVCYGMEIDPLYVDVAIRRWQKYTGEAAVHAGLQKTFNELAAKREVKIA